MSDRPVHAQAIRESVVVIGDRNTVTLSVPLSPASAVDLKAELTALREALDRLQTPERGKAGSLDPGRRG